jgi:type III pantothenate kinase
MLVIDAGNSFVKWALSTPEGDLARAPQPWIARGQVALSDLECLESAWADLSRPGTIIGSCVGGDAVRQTIEQSLNSAWPPIHWIRSEAISGKVTGGAITGGAITSGAATSGAIINGYAQPAQLGTDRWAALIGARALLGAQAALVVMCGTATTIDLLTAPGHFTGGVILPGLELMQTVLHERTAALSRYSGHVVAHPDCTADAIASGCLHAQAGAIERLWHLHRGAHEPLTCLIAGGAAPSIGPFLTVPYQIRADLVLLGLATIADSRSASSLPNTSS